MNTLTTILNKAKVNGNNYIYATCDSDANNGIEWCVRNGYVTKTREEAEEAVRTLLRWAGDDPQREARPRRAKWRMPAGLHACLGWNSRHLGAHGRYGWY